MKEEPKTSGLHHLSQALKLVSCKSATVVLSPDPLVLPVCSLGSWQQSHFYWHWIRVDWSSFVVAGNKEIHRFSLTNMYSLLLTFRSKDDFKNKLRSTFLEPADHTNTGKSASLLLTNWTLSNNPQVIPDPRNLPDQPKISATQTSRTSRPTNQPTKLARTTKVQPATNSALG